MSQYFESADQDAFFANREYVPEALSQGDMEYEIRFSDMERSMGRKIGEGSYGQVFLARGRKNEKLAVKVLKIANMDSSDEDFEEAIMEFRREILVMKELAHPNVVPLRGAITQEPPLCIVTDFCGRDNLSTLLNNALIDTNTGLRTLVSLGERRPMDWEFRVGLAMDVARGMAYLHTQTPKIIHRDLKPANLFIADDWTGKIGDFGLAKYGRLRSSVQPLLPY